jgi:NADH-quinone oxidoreductase subunit L
VVTVPLILLAIPSIVIGFLTIGPMLYGTDILGHAKQLPFFLGAIDVPAAHDVIGKLAKEFHGPVAFALHGFKAPAFWLALAGFALATVMYWWKPELHHKARRLFAWPVRVLEDKYGFDTLWIDGFAGGGVKLGQLSRQNDEKVIDGVFVNGSARLVDFTAGLLRRTQSGFLYHYAFAMILGLIGLLAVIIKFWR